MNEFSINGKRYDCPLHLTLNTIMGKWKAVILWNLSTGIKRYGELRRLLPGATDKMLTQQLRELEKDGIVFRNVYAQIPPKVEYSLTEKGETIKPLLELMQDWGSQFKVTVESHDDKPGV